MIVNGTPGFFPLSKIRSHLKDYYMTANGDIYSTRQQATPRKMTGTPAARNGRTYTFSTATGLPATLRGDDLFAEAKRHADWTKETAKTTETKTVSMPAFGTKTVAAKKKSMAKSEESEDRDHAASTAAGIAAKGYLIGKVEGEAIVFGSKPVIHTSLTSVKNEVARLAKRSPGTQIIYVKIEGSAIANDIAWA